MQMCGEEMTSGFVSQALPTFVFPGRLTGEAPGIFLSCIPSTGITSVYHHVRDFYVHSGTWMQIPVFGWQALYWLSYLFNPGFSILWTKWLLWYGFTNDLVTLATAPGGNEKLRWFSRTQWRLPCKDGFAQGGHCPDSRSCVSNPPTWQPPQSHTARTTWNCSQWGTSTYIPQSTP